MKMRWIGALLAVLILGGCGGTTSPNNGQTPAAGGEVQPAPPAPPAPAKKQWSTPPAMQIDPNKQYTATMKTSLGDIKIELFAKDAPLAVNNFVFLSREGFYNGVIFHRVIKGFMIQGGDPQGTGFGGPGYRFNDELQKVRPYDPGILAMANSGSNTNGSQFFICNGPSCRNLDAKPDFTQVGRVTEGMETVQKISNLETQSNDRPKQPPVIQSITIAEKA